MAEITLFMVFLLPCMKRLLKVNRESYLNPLVKISKKQSNWVIDNGSFSLFLYSVFKVHCPL
jgi:hypothetical protein